MKKILVLFVTCFLVIGNCSSVTAQVSIGGDGSVATGAVLDLSQQGAASGGLLLPQVVLTAENANPFGEGESTELPAGLLVYNLGSETEGEALDEGLYVLKGGLWVQAGSGGSTPLMNVAITPNTPVTLYSTGGTKQLTPTISIADSTTIIWKSSNTDVAVVSNKGVVSPIADGEAEITVSFGSTTSDPVAVTVTTPTCGAPFTAPSGMVYNTASYTFNPALCWTTNNIKEGTSTNDYSTMCYGNNCSSYPTRGYYYTPAQAKDVNICGKLGPGWRLPRNAEWGTLLSARNNLVGAVGTTGSPSELLKPWITAPDALAGVMNVFTDANGWGQYSYWYPGDGSNGACNNTIWQSDNTGHNGQCHGNPGMATVRCVYEI